MIEIEPTITKKKTRYDIELIGYLKNDLGDMSTPIEDEVNPVNIERNMYRKVEKIEILAKL